MKQFKYIAILLLFMYFDVRTGSAQLLQTAHWYFGSYAGLDFNSGNPVADLDGQIDYGEGSTAISDEFGNLMFYTDGRKVYDASHNQMPNGSGLWGFPTSCQPATIVPVPGTCDLYYIFTIDAKDNEVPFWRTKKGLSYSVVDMTLNDGMGDILPDQKNLNIPIAGEQQGYEKLTVVSKAPLPGYWVLTHFEGNFYAFEVTVDGINTDAVISPTPEMSGSLYIGNLKASRDGSKLAMGFYRAFCGDGGLAVYDFDNATGVVSNEIVLDPLDEVTNQRNFYGLEFSPDSELLYAACVVPLCAPGYQSGGDTYQILQYNLSAPSIADSEQLVSINPSGHGGMQLGLDDKVYFSQGYSSVPHTFLDRIEDPNTLGSPTITFNAVNLQGRVSGVNLPQFLTHYFHAGFSVNGTDSDWTYCHGEILNFETCTQGGFLESIHWDFGDGITSTELNPTHVYSEPGTFTVTVTMHVQNQGEFVQTLTIEILPQPVIDDIEVIPACYGAPAEITVSTDSASVYWYDDPETNNLVFTGDSFTTPDIYEATTWYFVADDGTCQTDPIPVTAEVAPELILHTADTLICRGDSASLSLHVSGGIAPYTYHWSGGYTDSDIVVAPLFTTTYNVSVSDVCGTETSSSATVTISPVKARFSAKVESVFDVTFTNHSIPNAQVESHWEFGDGNESAGFSPFHSYSNTREYEVLLTVTDPFGCRDSTMQLISPPAQVYIPNAFSPNEDGINDLFKVVAKDAKDIELLIFDRYGHQLHHSQGKNAAWNGSYNGNGYYVPPGVYVYKVTVWLEHSVEVLEYKGTVTVVR